LAVLVALTGAPRQGKPAARVFLFVAGELGGAGGRWSEVEGRSGGWMRDRDDNGYPSPAYPPGKYPLDV
jgi:hypothetical protein